MLNAQTANPCLSRWLGFPDLNRLPATSQSRLIVQVEMRQRAESTDETRQKNKAKMCKANAIRALQAGVIRAQHFNALPDVFSRLETRAVDRFKADGWIELHHIEVQTKYYRKTQRGRDAAAALICGD